MYLCFMIKNTKLITILGPTAVGKTAFAASLAHKTGAEIISADSRQVFKGMDIGTGKDIADYCIHGKHIPYHLIDIAEPGEEFSVFQFKQHFLQAYDDICKRDKYAIMCGGTGLYLESVLCGYDMREVPVNKLLRDNLQGKTEEELVVKLKSYKTLHNKTDIVSLERLLRAIEIEEYKLQHPYAADEPDFDKSLVFGLRFERETIRKRITLRLHQRLEQGMVEEVQKLLDKGVPAQRLKSYGLEYKFITMYLLAELSYNEMAQLLNTAIHQFAKRQMTWFRRMEQKGVKIYWLEGEKGQAYNLQQAEQIIKKQGV